MNRPFPYILLLVFLPLLASAQSEEADFTADRPGATTGTDVLPKGRLQWEMGVGYQQVRQNGATSYIWTLNTTLLRFGISDHAELRLQGDWNNEGGEIFDYNGSEDVAIGVKARLFDGWKFVPAISMLGNVIIPSKHYDNMLYPQYEEKMDKTIRKSNWDYIQSEAKKNLENTPYAHPNVIKHWQSIVDGIVPFGYRVIDD